MFEVLGHTKLITNSGLHQCPFVLLWYLSLPDTSMTFVDASYIVIVIIPNLAELEHHDGRQTVDLARVYGELTNELKITGMTKDSR